VARDVGQAVAQEPDVGGEHAAGHVGHAAHHHREELGAGHRGDIGFHGERGFGLPEEDVGGRGERFGAACAHRADHHPGHALDDLLHDAQVVEDAHERREEDDGGEHRHREDEAAGLGRVGEGAEDEARAFEREVEDLCDEDVQAVEEETQRARETEGRDAEY
jgi:hypothetical protein